MFKHVLDIGVIHELDELAMCSFLYADADQCQGGAVMYQVEDRVLRSHSQISEGKFMDNCDHLLDW
jgi:hypothetical protein